MIEVDVRVGRRTVVSIATLHEIPHNPRFASDARAGNDFSHNSYLIRTSVEGGGVRKVATRLAANSVTAVSSMTAETESHLQAEAANDWYASTSEPTLNRQPTQAGISSHP